MRKKRWLVHLLGPTSSIGQTRVNKVMVRMLMITWCNFRTWRRTGKGRSCRQLAPGSLEGRQRHQLGWSFLLKKRSKPSLHQQLQLWYRRCEFGLRQFKFSWVVYTRCHCCSLDQWSMETLRGYWEPWEKLLLTALKRQDTFLSSHSWHIFDTSAKMTLYYSLVSSIPLALNPPPPHPLSASGQSCNACCVLPGE